MIYGIRITKNRSTKIAQRSIFARRVTLTGRVLEIGYELFPDWRSSSSILTCFSGA